MLSDINEVTALVGGRQGTSQVAVPMTCSLVECISCVPVWAPVCVCVFALRVWTRFVACVFCESFNTKPYWVYYSCGRQAVCGTLCPLSPFVAKSRGHFVLLSGSLSGVTVSGGWGQHHALDTGHCWHTKVRRIPALISDRDSRERERENLLMYSSVFFFFFFFADCHCFGISLWCNLKTSLVPDVSPFCLYWHPSGRRYKWPSNHLIDPYGEKIGVSFEPHKLRLEPWFC